MDTLIAMLWLLVGDCVVVGLFILALTPLKRYKQAAFAVLKRNFIGYFSNPTGYVFLCLFVLLTSFAAFWPHEFFNSNMATLDQLNKYLPYIMLIFIPAITMSIWAEERREGTDELLLTIPAGDFDIVLGKYLATASIFSASLLFSQLSNFAVLNSLARGGVDMGLFITTYLGYWLVGMAMLAIGMVASFLTKNLTVGFILGAVFNVPLVFAATADVIIPWPDVAEAVRGWSLSAKFEDFGRGVASLSSVAYFFALVCVGVYLSVILIGRRHWVGGRGGKFILAHYAARAAAIVATGAGVSVLAANRLDIVRHDFTTEKISSLSPATHELIEQLNWNRPVYIDAYISKELPESYIRTKYEMVSLLRELKARQGDAVVVNIHDDMEPFSEDAKQAEEQFGIRPLTVQTITRGALSAKPVFLATAVECGLERVIVPFYGHGSSVEYELIRSIATVTGPKRPANEDKAPLQPQRRVIGIVRTDAHIVGLDPAKNLDDFLASMRLGLPQRVQPLALIDEIQKQYRIENVNPKEPISTGFLFSVDDAGGDELNAGRLPNELLHAFQENSIKIAADAAVTVTDRNLRWSIIDRSEDDTRSFVVRKIGQRLNVYDQVKYDVLLVVQPSLLTSIEMDHLLAAIKQGQPTALFEDPLPDQFRGQPGVSRVLPTDAPRRAPQRASQEVLQLYQAGLITFDPKADIQPLWRLLEVRLVQGQQATYPPYPVQSITWRPYSVVAWQDYNPYPKVEEFGDAIVFAGPNAVSSDPTEQIEVFNVREPAVAGLDEVAFRFPGAIEKDLRIEKAKKRDPNAARTEFIPLVRTSKETGILTYIPPDPPNGIPLLATVNFDEDRKIYPDSETETPVGPALQNLRAERGRLATGRSYVLAARIKSKDDAELAEENRRYDSHRESSQQSDLDVIVVTDIDFLENELLLWRNRPQDIDFRFQNLAFVMNIIDELAGDRRFLDIRKRQLSHASLRLVEDRERTAREDRDEALRNYEEQINQEQQRAAAERARLEQEHLERKAKLKAEGKLDATREKQLDEDLELLKALNQHAVNDEQDRLTRRVSQKRAEVDRELNLAKQKIQNEYKFYAVVIPPIPPLIVGLIVFIRRRVREREGVSAARLRTTEGQSGGRAE